MSDTEDDENDDERLIFEGLLISKGIRRNRKTDD